MTNHKLLYHCEIVDLREVRPKKISYDANLSRFDSFWRTLYEHTEHRGSLLVLARNYYQQNELLPFAYDIMAQILSRTHFMLKNIIIVHREFQTTSSKLLAFGHFLVLYFVKSIDSYYFDKDAIRQQHIFRKIEWGRRTRGKSGYGNKRSNRYSKKGRDPGNVFYTAIRDRRTGQILTIQTISDAELFQRLISVSTRTGGLIASNIKATTFRKLAKSLGRKFALLEEIK